jgi:hypothetical protein
MDKALLTRRAALSALTAIAVAPGGAVAAPVATRFREIRVDVSPLIAKDNDVEAKWVAAVLPGYLKQTFAKYLAPGDRGAAVLVARIDDIALGPPEARWAGGGIGPDTFDGIEGAGVALDGRGHVLETFPLYCSVGASSYPDLPNQQEENYRRRVQTLALSFAQWLPGKIGL